MYAIAVYYGVVKITKIRHTLSVWLLVDAISLIAAAVITNVVF